MVVTESCKEKKNRVSVPPGMGGHGIKHSCVCSGALLQLREAFWMLLWDSPLPHQT